MPFNPDEPRDLLGKWLKSKGSALKGDSAHSSVEHVSGLSSSEKQSIVDYGMPWGYKVTNPFLNQGGKVFDSSIMKYRPATPKEASIAKRITAGLDGAFAKAPRTSQAIVVNRGVSNVNKMFGKPGEMVGQRFTSKSFVSTTTVRHADTGFGYGYSKSGHGMAKLEIIVPAGSKMVHGNDFEHELLLDRESAFDVASDEVRPDGTRIIKLHYVPGSGHSS